MKVPKIKNEGIHNVPTEIWFQIIHEIDTVANLGKLFYLFPVARPAFALLDAHFFIDTLLEEGRGTCQNTNDMIRTCVLLRAGHMPIDAEQFHNGFIRESMRPYARHWTTIYGWTPRELDRKANVSTLISALKTAYIIDCATVECLDFYLDKFRSLKPQRPKFWREKAKSPYGENMGYVEWTANAWTPKEEGRPCKVHDVGRPNWSEEQRVSRALWRVQLFYEAKQYSEYGTMFSDFDIFDLYGGRLGFRNWWLTNSKGIFASVDNWISMDREQRNLHPEYEEIDSILYFIENKYGTEYAQQARSGQLSFHHTLSLPIGLDVAQRSYHLATREGGEWKKMMYASPGVRFFYWAHHVSRYAAFSPLEYLSFDDFSSYGFAFWSTQRMQGYRLLRGKPTSNEHFAWFSLMSPDTITRVEEQGKIHSS